MSGAEGVAVAQDAGDGPKEGRPIEGADGVPPTREPAAPLPLIDRAGPPSR